MNVLPPHPVLRNSEPLRPVTVSVPERCNDGTDGVPGDGCHPILSRHWPSFPASVTEAERTAA